MLLRPRERGEGGVLVCDVAFARTPMGFKGGAEGWGGGRGGGCALGRGRGAEERDVPYAMAEGMVSVRFSPSHMPLRPSSQPLMTWPDPTE